MKEVLTKIETAQTWNAVKTVIRASFPSTKKRRGSSRIVIPIDDQYVLKVAYNNKGISQNLNEYRVYRDMPLYYKRFLAKIKKADEVGGTWLIQKKVKIKNRQWDTPDIFDFAGDTFRRILIDQFDVIRGDCSQYGFLGERPVMYDYGLTQQEYYRLYDRW